MIGINGTISTFSDLNCTGGGHIMTRARGISLFVRIIARRLGLGMAFGIFFFHFTQPVRGLGWYAAVFPVVCGKETGRGGTTTIPINNRIDRRPSYARVFINIGGRRSSGRITENCVKRSGEYCVFFSSDRYNLYTALQKTKRKTNDFPGT